MLKMLPALPMLSTEPMLPMLSMEPALRMLPMLKKLMILCEPPLLSRFAPTFLDTFRRRPFIYAFLPKTPSSG
jgi:hypothetical protein